MAEREYQLNLPVAPLQKLPSVGRMPTLRGWVELFATAFRRFGSQKSVALTLGMTEGHLSQALQYDGDEHRVHLSVWRLYRMPPEFWLDLFDLILEYHDLYRTSQEERLSRDEVRQLRALLKGGL